MSHVTHINDSWDTDERIAELAKLKKELVALDGVAGERLLWDVNNFVRKLAEQRKYQASMVGVQTRADKVRVE